MKRTATVVLIAAAGTACTQAGGPTDVNAPTDGASPNTEFEGASASSSGATGSRADSGADTSTSAEGSTGPIEAGSGADGSAPQCTPGTARCQGNSVEACGSNNQWGAGIACAWPRPACASGACVQPPSCMVSAVGTTDCGASHEDCCVSPEVPGGTYDRTYDPVEDGGPVVAADGGPTGEADPATISGFRLDKYLVTVGRFRQYLNYLTGPTGAPPVDGSGIHTHLNGGRGLANSGSPGTFETGWTAADWDEEIPTGPGATDTWNVNLTACLTYSTWTPTAGSQENLPMNCVNWFEAYAFCIWDGGFLPSEAEWEYAAAGGSQEREYPWGSTDPGTSNQYAIYNCYYGGTGGHCASIASMAPVGTATLGAGAWGQLDMAGEVFEWNLDWYASYVDPCVDCAYLTTASDRATRGGNYAGITVNLPASDRSYFDDPTDSDNVIGYRCARAP